MEFGESDEEREEEATPEASLIAGGSQKAATAGFTKEQAAGPNSNPGRLTRGGATVDDEDQNHTRLRRQIYSYARQNENLFQAFTDGEMTLQSQMQDLMHPGRYVGDFAICAIAKAFGLQLASCMEEGDGSINVIQQFDGRRIHEVKSNESEDLTADTTVLYIVPVTGHYMAGIRRGAWDHRPKKYQHVSFQKRSVGRHNASSSEEIAVVDVLGQGDCLFRAMQLLLEFSDHMSRPKMDSAVPSFLSSNSNFGGSKQVPREMANAKLMWSSYNPEVRALLNTSEDHVFGETNLGTSWKVLFTVHDIVGLGEVRRVLDYGLGSGKITYSWPMLARYFCPGSEVLSLGVERDPVVFTASQRVLTAFQERGFINRTQVQIALGDSFYLSRQQLGLLDLVVGYDGAWNASRRKEHGEFFERVLASGVMLCCTSAAPRYVERVVGSTLYKTLLHFPIPGCSFGQSRLSMHLWIPRERLQQLPRSRRARKENLAGPGGGLISSLIREPTQPSEEPKGSDGVEYLTWTVYQGQELHDPATYRTFKYGQWVVLPAVNCSGVVHGWGERVNDDNIREICILLLVDDELKLQQPLPRGQMELEDFNVQSVSKHDAALVAKLVQTGNRDYTSNNLPPVPISTPSGSPSSMSTTPPSSSKKDRPQARRTSTRLSKTKGKEAPTTTLCAKSKCQEPAAEGDQNSDQLCDKHLKIAAAKVMRQERESQIKKTVKKKRQEQAAERQKTKERYTAEREKERKKAETAKRKKKASADSAEKKKIETAKKAAEKAAGAAERAAELAETKATNQKRRADELQEELKQQKKLRLSVEDQTRRTSFDEVLLESLNTFAKRLNVMAVEAKFNDKGSNQGSSSTGGGFKEVEPFIRVLTGLQEQHTKAVNELVGTSLNTIRHVAGPRDPRHSNDFPAHSESSNLRDPGVSVGSRSIRREQEQSIGDTPRRGQRQYRPYNASQHERRGWQNGHRGQGQSRATASRVQSRQHPLPSSRPVNRFDDPFVRPRDVDPRSQRGQPFDDGFEPGPFDGGPRSSHIEPIDDDGLSELSEYHSDDHRGDTFQRRQHRRSRQHGDRRPRAMHVHPDDRGQPRSEGRTNRRYVYNRRSASPSDYDEDDDYDTNVRNHVGVESHYRRRPTSRRS